MSEETRSNVVGLPAPKTRAEILDFLDDLRKYVETTEDPVEAVVVITMSSRDEYSLSTCGRVGTLSIVGALEDAKLGFLRGLDARQGDR
jgi:hypothetical protein